MWWLLGFWLLAEGFPARRSPQGRSLPAPQPRPVLLDIPSGTTAIVVTRDPAQARELGVLWLTPDNELVEVV